MISVEDQIRLAFRDLGIEHESTWVWDFVKKNTREFLKAEALAKSIVDRRRQGEPLAYILGEWPFMELDLHIAPGVLIPRPETEELAEKMVGEFCHHSAAKKKTLVRVLDLGAGSGALGLGFAHGLLKERPHLHIELHSVERSLEAKPTLQKNIKKILPKHPLHLNVTAHFQSWNDLSFDSECFDVLLGNPPYVSELEWREDVDNSVKDFEPRSALLPESLTAAQLTLARRFGISENITNTAAMGPLLENLEIARKFLVDKALIGIEIGPSQAELFESKWDADLASKFKISLRVVRDLSSKLRFLIGHKDG